MDNLDIPCKCEECGKRKPTRVRFGNGMARDFSRYLYAKFVCGKCDVLLGADE